jgi:hypothetical protein
MGMEKRRLAERVSLFVDREKELAELAESNAHAVLVGYRRMGKTHIVIKHLLRKWSKKTIPVYVDLLYFSSWEEFANGLVAEFLSAYDEANGEKLSSFFARASSSFSSALSSVKEIEAKFGVEGVKFFSLRLAFKEKKKSEFELLKEALNFISEFAEKRNVEVILALVEIQNAKNYGSTEQGLAILRGETQFAKNIRLIMSGSLPSFIYSDVLTKTKPFWKQLKTMEIKPFEADAVKEAAKILGVNEKHCSGVFAVTKGVPDYVIKVLNKLKARKEIGVSAAFESVVKDEELFFTSLLSSLSKAERLALSRIAAGEAYGGVERALGYPPTAVLNGLMAKGVVERVSEGKYAVIDPGLELRLKH